jgi:hypothetical protein
LSSLHRTDAQRPQTCLASTQALRSRHVSSALKSLDCVVAHRSDWCSSPVRPVRCCCTSVFDSSILALWINQGTQWFSGEPHETRRTRCSLHQLPLMTRLPRSPSSTLVLRLNQETVYDFILPFLPPCGPHLTALAIGPSNEAYLSSPHLEASPITTFRTCSSPTPTLVKPQPAPAILSKELVHTTLSITHHTKKRPSTGPRTIHGPHTHVPLPRRRDDSQSRGRRDVGRTVVCWRGEWAD